MSGLVTETESLCGITSAATSQAKSTHNSGAWSGQDANVWIVGGCLSTGLFGIFDFDDQIYGEHISGSIQNGCL